MYLGIYLKKNNNKKTGKNRKKKRTKKERKEQGSNPVPSARCELYLTTTPLRLITSSFNAFSTENPPANAVKDDRAA